MASGLEEDSTHSYRDDDRPVEDYQHMEMELSHDEIDVYRELFKKFDLDGSGTIDDKELRIMFEALGQSPTEAECIDMVLEVDEDGSGEIDFVEFIEVVIKQKALMEKVDPELEALDAWVSLGGNSDRSGGLSSDRLRLFVSDNKLELDIDAMLREHDPKGLGTVSFESFKIMFRD